VSVDITLNFSSKASLAENISNILKEAEFHCEDFSVKPQIEKLSATLIDDISFVTEFPYVDRHYRDTYYSFHSSKFTEPGRDCIRVHIFKGKTIKDEDFTIPNSGLNERYLGFFIIRPLAQSILGRSVISPNAFKDTDNIVCCLMEDHVSLLGYKLTVNGFPHLAQDSETHTCAESALWSFIEYYGSKYHDYKRLLPSQVVKTLLDSSDHRIIPSTGLSEEELAKCLNNNGFQCQIIWPSSNDLEPNYFSQVLQIYIESGLPLLLFLEDKINAHAVLAIGHELVMSKYDNKDISGTWVDVCSKNKKLVLIDDNMHPYRIADFSQPTALHPNPELRNMKIRSFIVPFPSHMFLVAQNAYAVMETVFNDSKVGLEKCGEKWITRLFLTSSRSFKKFILTKDISMPDTFKLNLLRSSLPRFIWIAEAYKVHEFAPDGSGICSALLIVDSTYASKLLTSVLWYSIEDSMYVFANDRWKSKFDCDKVFRMETYTNNLKGALKNGSIER